MKNEDKHQKIIQAALKVFAEKGFYNARISEIAKEAEVADGTIYLYFKNKDDILISLFEEEMGKLVEGMKREISQESDPLEKIRIFAFNHLNMVTQNRNLAEVLQVEIRQSSKFMKEYVNKRFIEYLNLISSIISEGQRRGVIRKDITPGIFKRAFFGALDEMARYWVLSIHKRYNITHAAQEITEIFIKGIQEEREGKN